MNPIELRTEGSTAAPTTPGVPVPPASAEVPPFVLRRPERTRVLSLLEGRAWNWVRPMSDLLALMAAVWLTINWPGEPVPAAKAWPLFLFPPAVMALLFVRGMYDRRLRPTILDGVVPVMGSISLAAMALVVVEIYVGGQELEPAVLAHVWGVATFAVGLGRISALTAQRIARAKGIVGRPTLIVGAGHVGSRIARRLEEHREYGLRPVGFLDADPPSAEIVEGRDMPVLGGPNDLDWIAQLTGAEHVVLAFSNEPDEQLVALVQRCEEIGLEVSLVPRLFESLNHRATYESLGGLPLQGLRAVKPRGWQFTTKHGFDRIAAAVLLLAIAPLLVAIAIAVRLSSPGAVLFRQRRVGRDGKAFDLLKFRSMAPEPSGGAGFTPQSGSAPGGIEGVDRRTRVGRFLRRSSLDELPQLINVLRGEMSLVGPRPERPEFVELFQDDIRRYGDRHRVRSGITGWAQVHGLRGQTSLADRVEWDNYYIEHWSLGLDLKILALTVLAVFRAAE